MAGLYRLAEGFNKKQLALSSELSITVLGKSSIDRSTLLCPKKRGWVDEALVYPYTVHTHNIYTLLMSKLDGVGPVDNRPFTDKLHNFVPKK